MLPPAVCSMETPLFAFTMCVCVALLDLLSANMEPTRGSLPKETSLQDPDTSGSLVDSRASFVHRPQADERHAATMGEFSILSNLEDASSWLPKSSLSRFPKGRLPKKACGFGDIGRLAGDKLWSTCTFFWVGSTGN